MKDFSWLPPIVKLSDHSGDTVFYLERIYKIFVDTVVNCRGVLIFNMPIGVSAKLEIDGKHERFWHTITDPHSPRLSDIKYSRAEKVIWIRPVMENYHRTEVLLYTRVKNKEKRLYLFIPEQHFILILKEAKKSYYFITAYHIDYAYKLDEYMREYKKYKV